MAGAKVANGIAVLALVASGAASYFAWKANDIANNSRYLDAAVRVSFTDTRLKSKDIKLVVYNTSATRMLDPQVELARDTRVEIVRLKDLPPCSKSTYLIDGARWSTNTTTVAFDDGNGHIWKKTGRSTVVQVSALDRDLPEHMATYSKNKRERDRGKAVILPTKPVQDETKNCG